MNHNPSRNRTLKLAPTSGVAYLRMQSKKGFDKAMQRVTAAQNTRFPEVQSTLSRSTRLTLALSYAQHPLMQHEADSSPLESSN